MVQLATGTVALHRIAAFMDRGMDPTLISFATAFDAVAAGGSTFLFGMLVRWVPARFLGAIGFSMLAIASVLTIYAVNLQVMFVSMWIFGMGNRRNDVLEQFHLGRLFRTRERWRYQRTG